MKRENSQNDAIANGILKAIEMRAIVLVHPRYLPQVLALQVQGLVDQQIGSLKLIEVRKTNAKRQ